MRIILILVGILFVNSVVAEPVTSFDNFDWGTSRTSITEIRGDPTYIDDLDIIYTDVKEEIGGYGISNVYFYFKKGCSKLKESISEPCYLIKGKYRLKPISENDFDEITQILKGIYGDYVTETGSRDILDGSRNRLLAVQTNTTLTYTQSDGSSVLLQKWVSDRDYTYYGNRVKSGIGMVHIEYLSKEYNRIQEEKKKGKQKGF